MTVTTLDPTTALIVVDLQAGLAALPTVHPFESVVANAARLADAFRARKLPVVLVNVAGGAPGRTEQGVAGRSALPDNWTDLLPELDQQPGDKTVTKYTWGAFQNTDLAGYLDALGVTQVVVVGVATSIGVESTARQAHEHGLNVTVATDAVTDLNPATHDNSVAHIFPRLGETGTTDEILVLL
ncbi:isochorismatase family protein [Kitasatospora sp. MAP5-34]|uniref:isochorismatase family protein n=1 Tax=Kitasatospora sp. MAP5-34 TaxID=3035102 RepID=UPI002472E97F|nr:isochorismatase family protein [Kitasatospora sp. MAP5-34]MDH6580282.1 nicotinamidase-related amidase [Kitasatospora sp. MAP5-34]